MFLLPILFLTINLNHGDVQSIPLHHYYDKRGHRVDNITAFALKQFQSRYEDADITRLDIFHYVYGVLHNPAYRREIRTQPQAGIPPHSLLRRFLGSGRPGARR